MEFIFIVGCSRSGTTFLAEDLGRMTEDRLYRIPYETAFFIDTYRKNQIQSKEQLVKIVDRMLYRDHIVRNYPNIHSKLIDKFFEIGGNNYGNLLIALGIVLSEEDGFDVPEMMIEKTPTHIFYLEKILKEFPSAKIIIIERNPLSVMSSAMIKGINRLKLVPISRKYKILAQYWEWQRNYEKRKEVVSKLSKNQVAFVRYEDLISRPNEVLTYLKDFIPVKFNSHFKVKKDTLDKYKEYFSEEEIKMITSFTPVEIAELYKMGKASKRFSDKVALLFASTLCKIEVFLVKNLPFYIKMRLKKMRGDYDVPRKQQVA